MEKKRGKARPRWEAETIKALRRHLGLTQRELARQMGSRQQTVSEWETGLYAPRGASATLLNIIAERSGFAYRTGQGEEGAGEGPSEEEQGSARASEGGHGEASV